MTVVDTPGFGDDGYDQGTWEQIVEKLKEVEKVDVFILALDGNNTRFQAG